MSASHITRAGAYAPVILTRDKDLMPSSSKQKQSYILQSMESYAEYIAQPNNKLGAAS